MSIWVLVSDASRAEIYSTEKQGDEWRVVGSYQHPESRLKNSDLTSTEPGHSSKSRGDSRRTAFESETSPKQVEMEHFAQQLADVLAAGTTERRCETIALVAPPHFLGLLRHRLSSETAKHILATVDKDLTFANAHEARQRLEEIIFAPVNH